MNDQGWQQRSDDWIRMTEASSKVKQQRLKDSTGYPLYIHEVEESIDDFADSLRRLDD